MNHRHSEPLAGRIEPFAARAVPDLADDLFLVAHDRADHSPSLAPRVLGLGLAGALLAELVVDQRLGVEAGQLWVTDSAPPPEVLRRQVLAELLADPDEREVRTWLEYLARREPEEASQRVAVAQRLTRLGILAPQVHRGWVRRSVRYVPVDARADWPVVRLRYQATQRTAPPFQDLLLVALVGATGLTRRIFAGHHQSPAEYVEWCTRGLPPPLRALVGEVAAAAARAVTIPT
ncbi:GPP34 family phosphoprotein [Cryptosporangium sp. NPDC048952]|uniref:GOLPH3/VPS74 family protein n=1 Tax=Cryptosporangium sp. NPDC048952 TaxID=3363961 RepID=UPI0037141C5C